jgi:hypothetical protein
VINLACLSSVVFRIFILGTEAFEPDIKIPVLGHSSHYQIRYSGYVKYSYSVVIFLICRCGMMLREERDLMEILFL